MRRGRRWPEWIPLLPDLFVASQASSTNPVALQQVRIIPDKHTLIFAYQLYVPKCESADAASRLPSIVSDI